MNEFKDKTAVITGAGSGIGRGLAEMASSKGMKVVLADINAEGLNETLELTRSNGVEVIARETDVSSIDAMLNLASETYETFGSCHLLFNNAGVLGPNPVKDTTREMYDWLININLGGCFNGIHAFLNRMLDSNEPSHIVSTCSTSGFVAYPNLGLYSASKFGIRGLMSSLRNELQKTKVNVSIVCPGEVDTNIVASTFESAHPDVETQKPDTSQDLLDIAADDSEGKSLAISPIQAAEAIFEGIENNDFYIFTHKGFHETIASISDEYLDALKRAKFQ
tara:strand:- start:475 stop:1311 length:837 start_codon:yes stop_codon:yes gene_type:complete